VAGEAGEAEVVFHPLADAGERPREEQEPFVLVFVADLTPPLMVAVLLTLARVTAGGLEMSRGMRSDPHVGPGRWNGERADPGERFFVVDRFAVGSLVGEAGPVPVPGDAGLRVADVT